MLSFVEMTKYTLENEGYQISNTPDQTLPSGIHPLDQSILLLPPPLLDLLLSGDRRAHIRRLFEINQFIDVILLGANGGVKMYQYGRFGNAGILGMVNASKRKHVSVTC